MKMLLGLLGLFLIELSAVVLSLKPPDYRIDIDSGSQGSYPVKKFISSKLQAPQANFLQWHPECDDGLYYFITPRGWKVSDPGPMILDAAGTMIWSKHFDNEFGGQAYDFKVQKYLGEEFLTFWLGDDTIRGHGYGHYYMLNSSYDIVYEIGAANDLRADLHDFVITPQGTALLVIFQPVKADVRPLGRKFNDLWNQAIWDCVFQEVHIPSGDLIFEWRASEHLSLTETFEKLASARGSSGTITSPFDWFHINSVDKDELGNYLVSARNLHAILYIDGKTKDVIWTLGGRGSDFQDLSDGHALNFAWQHDARLHSPDSFPEIYRPPPVKNGVTVKLMTLFDNAAMDWNYYYGPPYSRVLLLEVIYPTPATSKRQSPEAREGFRSTSITKEIYATHWREALSGQDLDKIAGMNRTKPSYSVRVVREYINPKDVISSTQGSAQSLSRGDNGIDPRLLVGYGINGVITEFSSNGSVLCDMHFGAVTSWEKGDVQSYRAYKFPWIGRPRQKPSLALRKDQVWASWNGATEYLEWVLQASLNSDGNTDDNWKEISRMPKQEFETSLPLSPPEHGISQGRYLRVLAICRGGQVCENGISEVIHQGRLSLLLSTERLRNFHLRLGVWSVLVISFAIASLLFLARMLRSLLRRRRSAASDGTFLLHQRRVD